MNIELGWFSFNSVNADSLDVLLEEIWRSLNLIRRSDGLCKTPYGFCLSERYRRVENGVNATLNSTRNEDQFYGFLWEIEGKVFQNEKDDFKWKIFSQILVKFGGFSR